MMHVLKCHSWSFNDILLGLKDFDVRKDDRGYQIGDWLYQREYNDDTKYTSRVLKCRVKYILKGGNYGLQEGYVILGIDNISSDI
jgi:hypothetical protein